MTTIHIHVTQTTPSTQSTNTRISVAEMHAITKRIADFSKTTNNPQKTTLAIWRYIRKHSSTPSPLRFRADDLWVIEELLEWVINDISEFTRLQKFEESVFFSKLN